jgi:hypothetical protein
VLGDPLAHVLDDAVRVLADHALQEARLLGQRRILDGPDVRLEQVLLCQQIERLDPDAGVVVGTLDEPLSSSSLPVRRSCIDRVSTLRLRWNDIAGFVPGLATFSRPCEDPPSTLTALSDNSEEAAMTDLPDLQNGFALPAGCAAAFQRDGHTRVRGLATPEEVAAFRPALVAAGDKGRYDRRPLEQRDTYGKAFVQMFNLWRHHETARAFVFARRFARVAAELMGVPGVRLYHDQALFKEPGGGPTPWHQDQFYWPLDTEHTITLWMPLVAVSEAMGPMSFASGSQRLGSLGDFPIGEASQREFERLVAQRALARASYGAFDPGDASFHAGWTLHCAGPNRTAHMREVMTIIYFADGTRVGALDHRNRRFDRDTWLPGCEPGELAASRLNPLLYSRA